MNTIDKGNERLISESANQTTLVYFGPDNIHNSHSGEHNSVAHNAVAETRKIVADILISTVAYTDQNGELSRSIDYSGLNTRGSKMEIEKASLQGAASGTLVAVTDANRGVLKYMRILRIFGDGDCLFR